MGHLALYCRNSEKKEKNKKENRVVLFESTNEEGRRWEDLAAIIVTGCKNTVLVELGLSRVSCSLSEDDLSEIRLTQESS